MTSLKTEEKSRIAELIQRISEIAEAKFRAEGTARHLKNRLLLVEEAFRLLRAAVIWELRVAPNRFLSEKLRQSNILFNGKSDDMQQPKLKPGGNHEH